MGGSSKKRDDGWWTGCCAISAITCAVLTVLGGVLGLGLWLFFLGRNFEDAKCDAPVAKVATGVGIFYMVLAAGLAFMASTCWYCSSGSGKGMIYWTMCLFCFGLAALWTNLGLQIWGTITAFQDSLWTRVLKTTPGNEACDPTLYKGVAYYLIVAWVAPVAVLPVVAMVATCFGFCSLAFMDLWTQKTPAPEFKREEEVMERARMMGPSFTPSYERGMLSEYYTAYAAAANQESGWFSWLSGSKKKKKFDDLDV